MSEYYLVVTDDSLEYGKYESKNGKLHSSGIHDNGTGYLLSHYVYQGKPDDETKNIIQVFPIEMSNGHLPEDVWYFDSHENQCEDKLLLSGSDNPNDQFETSDEQGGFWIHINFTQEYTNNPAPPTSQLSQVSDGTV